MLALLFYIGDTMYTIKCDLVREIAPLAKLKEAPHTPNYFAGFFNYRGTIIPVIDLCRLIQDEPCRQRLSTRIILVDYRPKGDSGYLLGLIAERVSETIKKKPEDFNLPRVKSDTAPYLGGIIMEGGKMIHHIDIEKLPNCISLLPGMDGGEQDDAQ